MDWNKITLGQIDVRLFYANIRDADHWTKCRWDPQDTDYPSFYRKSNVTEYYPICYSNDALKYAQTGYLCSIVCV